MSISFSSATGNLFNRWGKCALILKQLRSYHNSQKTNLIDTTNGLIAQFNAEPDIQAKVGTGYIGALGGAESAASLASTIAATTANRIVFNDNPRIGQTLTGQNTTASMAEIIRQMKLQGASVLAMTITNTINQFTSFASNTGNAVVVVSTNRPLDGKALENTFGETVTVTCTSDSYSGNATAGNEPVAFTGQGAQTDFFAFNWPLGSNCNKSGSVINGNANNSQGNVLNNSGFDTWTANVPNKWTLFAGTAGTNIAQESSLVYDGAGAINFIGDGSTNVEIRQQFNSSSGTTNVLSSSQQYGVCLFARRGGTSIAAGTLTIDLIDSTGTVIKDNNAVANTISIDMTTFNTNYAPFKGVFRTPEVLPSTVYIRLKQTVAQSNSTNAYIDKLSMGLMTQLYTSGPFVSAHAGSNPLITGDYATIVFTNGRGAAGTLDTFQTAIARLLPAQMYNQELLLPSSASPTISDGALIA